MQNKTPQETQILKWSYSPPISTSKVNRFPHVTRALIMKTVHTNCCKLIRHNQETPFMRMCTQKEQHDDLKQLFYVYQSPVAGRHLGEMLLASVFLSESICVLYKWMHRAAEISVWWIKLQHSTVREELFYKWRERFSWWIEDAAFFTGMKTSAVYCFLCNMMHYTTNKAVVHFTTLHAQDSKWYFLILIWLCVNNSLFFSLIK